MKVSLNWMREFINIDLPVDELVKKINAQLGAVEEVINLGQKYRGAHVVEVVACEKHPNADKLSVCLIDDGKAVKNVKRNKDGLVQVVCGAPNVAAGQLVVWLPPGVTVPITFDKEPFVLEAREIRGVVSNGMIASARELALGDDHSGILVLDKMAKPGQSFATTYGLDDHIIDIENKMFTHRPDLFGILGVAREIAGIQHQPFKSMPWYNDNADLHSDGRKNVLELAVKNELPSLVPRFTAIAIKDIKVTDSPVWLRARLSAVGIKPINNIVDITNYLMMETAQPLHAYDYDKVKTGVLGVRESRKGEQVTVIGGKVIKLKAGAIVITDGQRAIGLGGVMGGADTEVDENTKNIILEVANFDMNVTRRTAMEYGLFTDAATRFTKNQSSRQQKAVLCRATELIKHVAGGRLASPIIDVDHSSKHKKPVKVSADFINSRLGLNLAAAEVKKLLQNVEFQVETGAGNLSVLPPFWRTDIELDVDIVEEVGRLYGYDHLPLVLPRRSIKPTAIQTDINFKTKVRQALVSFGANEVLTYSFVHGQLMEKCGQSPSDAYHIKNALSPDLQYYRLSLTPSLLDKLHGNIKAGFEEFAIFEIGRAHVKGLLDAQKLPVQFSRLALVYASKQSGEGAAFYRAKRYVELLLANRLGVSCRYVPLEEFGELPKQWQVAAAPYEPKRSAILVGPQKTVLGIVGEPRAVTKNYLKLPGYTAMAELDLSEISQQAGNLTRYYPINKYPETSQDLCLRLPANTSYAQAEGFLLKALEKAGQDHGYQHWLKPIDIFQKKADRDHKQITWHVVLSHPERTLTTDEVNKLFDIISNDAKANLKAERV